jgi:hypothetical protein
MGEPLCPKAEVQFKTQGNDSEESRWLVCDAAVGGQHGNRVKLLGSAGPVCTHVTGWKMLCAIKAHCRRILYIVGEMKAPPPHQMHVRVEIQCTYNVCAMHYPQRCARKCQVSQSFKQK